MEVDGETTVSTDNEDHKMAICDGVEDSKKRQPSKRLSSTAGRGEPLDEINETISKLTRIKTINEIISHYADLIITQCS